MGNWAKGGGRAGRRRYGRLQIPQTGGERIGIIKGKQKKRDEDRAVEVLFPECGADCLPWR